MKSGTIMMGVGRSGVALDGGLGVGHFEFDVGGKFAGEAAFLFAIHVEDHVDDLAFFHQVGVLDDVLLQLDLVEGFVVHEVEPVLFGIDELILAVLNRDDIDLFTGVPGLLQNTAVLEVAEFGFDESGAFARFHVLEPYDRAGFSFEIEVESVLEISCCCHKTIDILMIIPSLQPAKI